MASNHSTNGTATATDKTAECTLQFTSKWVEIESVKSGKKMRLTLNAEVWRCMLPGEATLISTLTGDEDADADITLTYAEMRTFKEMCERLNPIGEKWAEEQRRQKAVKNALAMVPTVTVAPIAPVTPTPVIEPVKITESTATESAKRVHQRIEQRTWASGQDQAEQRINTLQAVCDKASKQYVMLVYDIPTSKNATCPNPSGILWNHGFRINLSCWVLPKERMSHPKIMQVIQAWNDEGIIHHTVEYAESQLNVIREIARAKLDEEIRRQHTSLIECLDSASKSYQEAIDALATNPVTDTYNARARLEQVRDNKQRAILKKAGEQLDAAVNCAMAFDETDNVKDLLQGLREAIRSQVTTFNMRMAHSQGKRSTVKV